MTDTELDRLAADYWDAYLERHPTYATAIGDHRFDDRMADDSPAAVAAWRSQLDGFERRLAELPPDAEPVTRAALGAAIETARSYLDADLEAFNVDPMEGPQVHILNIPSYHSARNAEEADALVARWRAMPAFLDQAAANLRRGLSEGRTGVGMLVNKVDEGISEILAKPDEEWPLLQPAEPMPELRDRLLDVVGSEIRPALERYRAVVVDEVGPRARSNDQPGLMHLPGGRDTYARLARAHTSLDTPPEEIHRIGLAEIERIDAEFVDLGGRLL